VGTDAHERGHINALFCVWGPNKPGVGRQRTILVKGSLLVCLLFGKDSGKFFIVLLSGQHNQLVTCVVGLETINLYIYILAEAFS
jgi:hypothetical protein